MRKSIDSNLYFLNATHIHFEPNYNPILAFYHYGRRVIFVDQKRAKTSPFQYIRTYRMFEFESGTGVPINRTHELLLELKRGMNRSNIPYGSDESVLMISDTKEAIGFIRGYMLFKQNESIIYCGIHHILLVVSNS